MTSDTEKRRHSPRDSAGKEPSFGEDGFMLALFILGVAILAFIAGSFFMNRGYFPADQLRRAFQSGAALYDQSVNYRDPLQTDFWQEARTDARGVVLYDPDRAQAGLTLYTSTDDQSAFLIDMNGQVVYRWRLPYSQVWDDSAAVEKPQPDDFVWIEKAHVFPNGDLLALYAANGDTPWGYGLVKMDRESRVIWRYLMHAHHDFDIDEDGNIYVLTQTVSEDDLPGYESLSKPRIDDFVVKLSPDGRELAKLWLMGAFAESPYGRRLHFVPWEVRQSRGDYLHANSIELVDEPVPGVTPSKKGQLLVSLREVNTVALADLDRQSIVWAATGPWLRQHDAQFLPNGRLLLFDNEGAVNGFGNSRVLELDPATAATAWSYGDRPDQPLDSVARSSQTRLENGNTLIVESMAGRVLEVTPEGRIVWDFVNPVRGGERNERIPVIFWVERLDRERDFTPEFQKRLARP